MTAIKGRTPSKPDRRDAGDRRATKRRRDDKLKSALAAQDHTRDAKTAKALLWAVKIRKTKSNGWMPDEVVVGLDGDRAGVLLVVDGWSSVADKPKWTRARIEKNLTKLARNWVEDVGKGWRLEIR